MKLERALNALLWALDLLGSFRIKDFEARD